MRNLTTPQPRDPHWALARPHAARCTHRTVPTRSCSLQGREGGEGGERNAELGGAGGVYRAPERVIPTQHGHGWQQRRAEPLRTEGEPLRTEAGTRQAAPQSTKRHTPRRGAHAQQG